MRSPAIRKKCYRRFPHLGQTRERHDFTACRVRVPILAAFFAARACPEQSRRGGDFSLHEKSSAARYFRRLRLTGLRKISHPSRYFSYFDRFFRLPGYSFSDFNPSTTRTGNTYHASAGFA